MRPQKKKTWQQEREKVVRNVEELKKHLPLNAVEEEQIEEITKLHPMRIPDYYLKLMDQKDPDDPLRKRGVPSAGELISLGEYDTSGEAESTKQIGLQHKYVQTALILATRKCVLYCRHCFRKRLVGLSSKEILHNFRQAVNYIKKHPQITNVLVSGGDPLVLRTQVIENFLSQLSQVKHLDFIRFGSCMPVTFPRRILYDDSLVKVFKKYADKKQIYIVTHFIHPREITPESIAAIKKLLAAGVMINNQTVLLNKINDQADVLVELMKKLVDIGVGPYYIFQCRPVARVKTHFQVPFIKGTKIIRQVNQQLDGHTKRFRFMMSHWSGKIEILGLQRDKIYFKYHQARNPKMVGEIFWRKIKPETGWLDRQLKLI